jgi:hypothetical protein
VNAQPGFAGRFGYDLIGRFRAIGFASRAVDGKRHPALHRIDLKRVFGAARALDFDGHSWRISTQRREEAKAQRKK